MDLCTASRTYVPRGLTVLDVTLQTTLTPDYDFPMSTYLPSPFFDWHVERAPLRGVPDRVSKLPMLSAKTLVVYSPYSGLLLAGSDVQ